MEWKLGYMGIYECDRSGDTSLQSGEDKGTWVKHKPTLPKKHQNWGEHVNELVQRTTCCLYLDAKWVYPVAKRDLTGQQRFEPGRYTWALQISYLYIAFFIILFRNCLDVIVPATAAGLQSLLDCQGLSTDSFLTWTSSSSGVGRLVQVEQVSRLAWPQVAAALNMIEGVIQVMFNLYHLSVRLEVSYKLDDLLVLIMTWGKSYYYLGLKNMFFKRVHWLL